MTIVAVSAPERTVTPTETALGEVVPTTPAVNAAPEPLADPTTASLLFMIEEEKLAHDVYVTLGDLWGSTIFSSISTSEATHQDQLLVLLDDRAITDPRSTETGVFVNSELQALYDELITQGSVSRAAAMQVGIAIETKDITDIAAAAAAEDDAEVIAVYDRLLAGSENHLAAFSRQR
ncbi:MAG: DUF2202 domain-containing protein [Actinobacteria bacterium]|nr:DUF2202 domain-containing protein [Actinomycetota bacterium]